MFKKRRGIKLSYNEQGLIHFICMNAERLDKECDIEALCQEIAGDDWKALHEVLTNDKRTVYGIADRYYMSEKRLYSLRKEFYERFIKMI